MPSTLTYSLLAALAGVVAVSAHGHVALVTIYGKSYQGFYPTSAPYGPQPPIVIWSNGATDNGFVLSSALQDPDVICHLDATNAALSAPVATGGDVLVTWNQWANSHKSPVIDYLADCGTNCSSVDKTTLKWIKIAEMGELQLGTRSGTPGKWADDLIIENNLTWKGEAQLYPKCINLEISGADTQSPDGVIGTQLYTVTDPGILHNIYNDESLSSVSDYKIPRPTLAAFNRSSSSGNGSSSGVATSMSAASSIASTSTITQPAVSSSATTKPKNYLQRS
ncbi:lytic polysaccharide monooxygenase [Jackrogersella minutella]|nr:lytic polysaccharide monooxygenase [Jackrogersella minutella]